MAGTPIEMHGATIVEVDGEGLVTSWRDYLDRKEPEIQLRAAHEKDAHESEHEQRGTVQP